MRSPRAYGAAVPEAGSAGREGLPARRARYVVTGAAGFIGSHLAEALVAAEHDVLALDCFTDYYDARLKEENAAELEIARIDLAEDPLDDLLADADGVFHFAGQPGVRASFAGFDDYLRRNVLASQRLFDAAAAAGTRVVFASSSSVYGDAERYPTPEDAVPQPISPYGVTKLACEQLVSAYTRSDGLEAVVLRLFTVYGPRQRPDMAFARIIAALAEGGTFELFGDVSRGCTFVGDVVEASVAAMERAPAGAVYNVGGGAEATMREAIAVCERVSGRSLDVRFRRAAPGDARRTSADSSRIRAELGWQPRVGLEPGLRAQWEWASARVAAR
jgi:UDP-glucuronate 4-epimerase